MASYNRALWRRKREPGIYIQFRNWNPSAADRQLLERELPGRIAIRQQSIDASELRLEFHPHDIPVPSLVNLQVMGVGDPPPDYRLMSHVGHAALEEVRRMVELRFKFFLHETATPDQEI